ncbi:Beta-ketoacyl synthase, C-terminal [Dillenia turbinata]|uniref:beta-ketoacyl-[acyl-carrier-protein] synthase I n=1 Tax=Dillenia turbinata TaxID=194707 RepID=A0AAN8YXH2_9MAGN
MNEYYILLITKAFVKGKRKRSGFWTAMAKPSSFSKFSLSRLQFHRFLSSKSRPFDPPPPISSRRVVITGLGMVTPLGCGVEVTWKRLIEGKCGVRALNIDDLKMSGFDRETQLHCFDHLTSKIGAVVPCGVGEGEFNEQLWVNSKDHRSIARFISYALCASDEALKDARWFPSEQEQKERTGVSIGGGIGSISDIVDAAQLICEKRLRRLSPFFIPRILINMASGHVSMKYGFQIAVPVILVPLLFITSTTPRMRAEGPNHAAVTACATGAHSIGDATRMIQFGDADVMVAGGTESSIDALSIAGFCRTRALSTKYNSTPEEASRPFDCGRDGFVIGEGSGVMVLEELDHARQRGANIYAEIRGYGLSGDAYHITQPHTDGRGATMAMTSALKQSGLHPFQVDYINAHATSTPLGDAIEANAIKSLFSCHATSDALAFSSTKWLLRVLEGDASGESLFILAVVPIVCTSCEGATGHLLGAAGAVEAIFAVLAIHRGIVPPTLNLNNPDPMFDDSFMPLTTSKEMSVRAALSNSFGFGGTNASLLFTSAT